MFTLLGNYKAMLMMCVASPIGEAPSISDQSPEDDSITLSPAQLDELIRERIADGREAELQEDISVIQNFNPETDRRDSSRVQELQRALVDLGFSIETDGQYGPNTHARYISALLAIDARSDLQQRIENTRRLLQEMERRYDTNAQLISEQRDFVSRYESQREELQDILSYLTESLEGPQSEYENLTEIVARIHQQLAALSAELETLKSENADTRNQIAQIEGEFAELLQNEDIEQGDIRRLREQRERFLGLATSLSEQLESARIELESAQAEVQNALNQSQNPSPENMRQLLSVQREASGKLSVIEQRSESVDGALRTLEELLESEENSLSQIRQEIQDFGFVGLDEARILLAIGEGAAVSNAVEAINLSTNLVTQANMYTTLGGTVARLQEEIADTDNRIEYTNTALNDTQSTLLELEIQHNGISQRLESLRRQLQDLEQQFTLGEL